MQSEAIIKSIGVLEEAVRNLAASAAKLDDRSRDERHAMYERIDIIRGTVVQLTARLDELSGKMEDIEPKVDKLEEIRHRAIGARNLTRILWGVIVSLITIGLGVMGHLSTLWHAVSK